MSGGGLSVRTSNYRMEALCIVITYGTNVLIYASSSLALLLILGTSLIKIYKTKTIGPFITITYNVIKPFVATVRETG